MYVDHHPSSALMQEQQMIKAYFFFCERRRKLVSLSIVGFRVALQASWPHRGSCQRYGIRSSPPRWRGGLFFDTCYAQYVTDEKHACLEAYGSPQNSRWEQLPDEPVSRNLERSTQGYGWWSIQYRWSEHPPVKKSGLVFPNATTY